MSELSEKIKGLMTQKDVTYDDLAKRTGISKSALQRYATGETEKIPIDRVQSIAAALGTTAQYLLGWDSESKAHTPKNIVPFPDSIKIPIIGTIACGEPILADENLDGYAFVPEFAKCDFCLRCKGDSMIGARIFDGDLVAIRQQDDVDDGEIAAVLVDDEATLKRVYKLENKVILRAENPTFKDMIYTANDAMNIKILGKAVFFISAVR